MVAVAVVVVDEAGEAAAVEAVAIDLKEEDVEAGAALVVVAGMPAPRQHQREMCSIQVISPDRSHHVP